MLIIRESLWIALRTTEEFFVHVLGHPYRKVPEYKPLTAFAEFNALDKRFALFDLAVHRNVLPWEANQNLDATLRWTVHEGTTGLRVAQGLTEHDAVMSAVVKLEAHTVERLCRSIAREQSAMDLTIYRHSPRYEWYPVGEYTTSVARSHRLSILEHVQRVKAAPTRT